MPKGQKKEFFEPVLTELKDTNVVQKSKPLFSLWKSSLTLSEFKILDTYLSRINSRNPESRTVIFEKGELEKLLGVERIRQPELQKRLRHLQGTIVSVGEGKDIDEITLFERSQAAQDENGLWQIRLTASISAMKYIFNIEKIGYFRYKIRAITKLRSLYSYTLFMYLEYNKYKNKWTENLNELKKILSCDDELYNEYKYFNQRILHRCQKEIMENTPLSFTYTSIKRGRKVVAVCFEVEKNPQIEITPDIAPEASMSEVPVSESVAKVQRFDIPEFVSSKSVPDERPEPQPQRQTGGTFDTDFTPEQVRLLCDILAPKLLERDRTPERIESNLRGLYSKMRLSYNYIGNPLSLLLKFIDNLETPKETKKPNKTKKSNFNEDMYDIFVNDFETINREI